MVVVEDTAVHLKVPSSDLKHIVGFIDKCEVLKDDGTDAEVLVYWGLTEMQRLVKIYGDAPNPMNKEYTWPGIIIKPLATKAKNSTVLALVQYFL